MASSSSLSSPEIALTSSADGLVAAFNPSSGATVAQFSGSRSPRKGLALAGKSHIAVSHISPETGAGSIHIYNWWSHTAFRHLSLPEPSAPLTATSDGAYIFAGGISGQVHVVSLSSGDVVKSFQTHTKPISCTEISSDGSLLILGGEDSVIIVLPIFSLLDYSVGDSPRHLILHRLMGHSTPVTAIAAGAVSMMISCSLDGACVFWNLVHGTRLRMVVFSSAINGIAMDPIESEFYAGGSDGWVYGGEMRVASRKAAMSQPHEPIKWAGQHDGAVVGLAVTNGGSNLVTASEEGAVWVWTVKERSVVKVLREGFGAVSALVVARGLGDWKRSGGDAWEGKGGWFSGVRRPVMEENPASDDLLNEVVKDRTKAVDMLESAIGMYERLLELILKEAKKGTNRGANNGDGKDGFF